MRCRHSRCPRRSWVLSDHRIAAKNCLLTTRAAKWATVQVGTGRTVSEVAGELDCDWHTVNDAVTTYGKALLEADRKRLNKTTAWTRPPSSASVPTVTPTTPPRWRTWRTTRSSTSSLPADTSTWRAGSTSNRSPGKSASNTGPWTCRAPTRLSTRSFCPERPRSWTPSTSSRSPTARSTPSVAGSRPSSSGTEDEETTPCIGPDGSFSWARRSSTPQPPSACGHCSNSVTPVPRWPSPIA